MRLLIAFSLKMCHRMTYIFTVVLDDTLNLGVVKTLAVVSQSVVEFLETVVVFFKS